jgi:hypothetical protein
MQWHPKFGSNALIDPAFAVQVLTTVAGLPVSIVGLLIEMTINIV